MSGLKTFKGAMTKFYGERGWLPQQPERCCVAAPPPAFSCPHTPGLLRP